MKRMPTIKPTKDTFEQTILSSGVVPVDFRADLCGPGKMFAPTYEPVSAK
jgi:hypothetical protein